MNKGTLELLINSPSATIRLPQKPMRSFVAPAKASKFFGTSKRVPSPLSRPSCRLPAPQLAGQSPLSSHKMSTTLASKRAFCSCSMPHSSAAHAVVTARSPTAANAPFAIPMNYSPNG